MRSQLRRNLLTLLVPVAAFSFLVRAKAQTSVSASQRDPQAVALITSALAALDLGTTVTDATLQATVAHTTGQDVLSGTATLEAKVGDESKAVLNLAGGQRQEIHSGTLGAWIGADGQQHFMAMHNCLTGATWFFPAITLETLFNDPTVAFTYVALENLDNRSVQHLQSFHLILGQGADAQSQIQRLSTMDVYLDATSSLPVAMDYKLHPDDDPVPDVFVEVRFDNYQTSNGVLVPQHAQQLLDGTLALDLNVTSAAINTGLPDSEFAPQ